MNDQYHSPPGGVSIQLRCYHRWIKPKLKHPVLLLLTVLLGNMFLAQAQITLKATKQPLADVIKKLRAQTDYAVMVQEATLAKAAPVTVDLRDISLQKALEAIFKNQPLSFEIKDRTILIKAIEKAKARENGPDRQESITGRVTNEKGEPLVGATVYLLDATEKRTKQNVVTDGQGYFNFNLSEGATIEITYVGYISRILEARGTMHPIILTALSSELEEVVVNKGYYTESRRLSTGSVGKISEETIAQQPVTNVMGALIARIPGLEVTQGGGIPGAGFQIRIRGQNSIAAGKNPLFIVDGVPFASESLGYNQVSRQLPFIDGNIAVSPFNTLNPSDIENIEVLKDADATAIYGSRGANGVILITTKKGRAGKTQYEFNLNTAFNWAPKLMETISTEEYLAIRKEAFANDGVTTYPVAAFDVNGTWDQNRYTDWEKELLGNIANSVNFQGGVSGGSQQTQFLVRGGYQRENTIFPGDFKYQRGSVLANINHKSTDGRFNLDLSSNYATDDNNMSSVDFTRSIQFLAPNAPAMYLENGELNWENWPSGTSTNPMSQLVNQYDGSTQNLSSNLTLAYRPFPEFEIKANLGYSNYRLDEFLALPSTQYNPASGLTSRNSMAYKNAGSRQGWIIEPQASWKKGIGQGKLDILIGSTFQYQSSNALSQLAIGFPSNALIYNLPAATTLNVARNDDVLYKYQAVFGRLNYNLQDKYVVNLTARRDGSSRFSPERQFANFGAVGAAWLFSNEPFFQQTVPFISFGKLRGSYGLTGNDQIGDYQFLDTYTTNGNNYMGISGLLPEFLYNADFGWETNRKLETSIELGFFKDRLYTIFSWYRNRSSDQLVGIPLAGTTGFSSIQSNLGAEVQNTGLEFEVQATPIRSEKFTWRVSANFTLPKNKLLSFPGLEVSTYSNMYVVGQPLSIVKAYHMTGINPQTGIYEYEDVNGDGQLSASYDRNVIRNIASHFYGGLSNSFSYGGLSLDLFFQFVKKTGFNYLRSINQPGRSIASITKEAANGIWQPGRTDATIQVLTAGSNIQAVNAWSRLYQSDVAISDFYFIRLKNIALSYQVKPGWLGGVQARVFAQGQNLLTLTDYLGGDPETTLISNLPPLKTVNFGVQLTF